MAGGYSIAVDTPPFGVSFIADSSVEAAAERASALIAEGRTVYVTTPEGDLVSGNEFLAELADRR